MARGDHRDMGSSEGPAEVRSSQARAHTSSGPPAQPPSSEAQLDLEDLKIDRAGEIPIGVQLAWALRARIGDGRLAAGQRLPGLRELAEMLGINANTARSVYQRLEQEGLIDSRQGTGTFVASVTQGPSAVGQIVADAALQARRTGVDPREVAAALYVTAEAPADATAHPDGHTLTGIPSRAYPDGHRQAGKQAAERRKELRAQIAALEQTLSELQALHPGLIPAPSKPLRHAGPRLLSVQELERVRMALVRRLAAAEPMLDTQPAKAQAQPATRARKEAARVGDISSDTHATDKQAKQSAAKKATHPRPRTRPSTA
jgi:DNA-binding transcriptional regulator YhcF (GntR family)